MLGCGIVASAWWVVMDVVGSLRYPGYSYIDQTISELGVEERMNAYASMLWFAVLAIGLLRAQATVASRQLEQPTVILQPLAR
ncbi:MAG TPA: hypothetical protein VFU22_10580 [Roseiflexaceae bacterium]|nr:hypothetical protein [Roseiflexaceae bacterium]